MFFIREVSLMFSMMFYVCLSKGMSYISTVNHFLHQLNKQIYFGGFLIKRYFDILIFQGWMELYSAFLCVFIYFFLFILLTHKGSLWDVYQEFQPRYDICRRWCCLDHRFRAPPANTDQLLTLHQHWANNQYRTANQI